MTQSDNNQPMVGIFWLFRGRLIIDASPLPEAEPYGDCLTHRNSHIDYWTEQQRLGVVPKEIEYEEPPRGRVVFHTKTARSTLYADRCILAKKAVIKQIKKTMHLPSEGTDVRTDGHHGHYRCYRCLETSDDGHCDS